MSNKTILNFFFVFLGFYANAQKISLSDAIQKGLENRIELKTQALNVELSIAENKKNQAKWQPQVAANGDVRWNTQLQTTVLPFALPGSSEKQTTVRLGRPINNTFGLQVEQKIYDGSRKLESTVAQAQTDFQKNNLELQAIAIKQSISEAYYAVIYYQEKLTLAENSEKRARIYWETANEKASQGLIIKSELDKFSLDLSNAQYNLTKSKQDYELSLEEFRYKIGTDEKLIPSESLQNILSYSSINHNPTAVTNRIELKNEEINLQLNGLSAQKVLLRNRPTVTAYGNYSAFQLAETFNPLAKQTWFTSNFIGIRANISIFDGKLAKLQSQDFLVRQKINRLSIEKLTKDFQYEATMAANHLTISVLNLDETKKNISLALAIMENDKFRFTKGLITPAELKNTEFSLQNAENQYTSAIYNVLLANIRYRKAIGTL